MRLKCDREIQARITADKTVLVMAHVRGNLAISRERRGAYTLTHIPTGLNCIPGTRTISTKTAQRIINSALWGVLDREVTRIYVLTRMHGKQFPYQVSELRQDVQLFLDRVRGMIERAQ